MAPQSIYDLGEDLTQETMTTWGAILWGLGLGGSAACVLALFLIFSRERRRVRSPLIVGLGYLLIGRSAIGSLLALLAIGDRFGVDRHDPRHYVTLYSYTISYGCWVFASVLVEVRWRKSVGLDDKSLVASPNKKH